MKQRHQTRKGRGAQFNTPNPYLDESYVTEHPEALDEPLIGDRKTEYLEENPKKIVNKVLSPDIGLEFSMNPYQGCEHGCIYCYARNTHQYWGYSAGLDFESKIIVKRNAAQLLEQKLQSPRWQPVPIMLSGNTDCYQPVERQLQLTRQILEVLVKYRHPVGMITKNQLILRDLDLLTDLAEDHLVSVAISITTLNESLRQKMEPRTATAHNRLKVLKKLSENGIPTTVMAAPIIPGLNDHEIPALLKAAAEQGAQGAGYTMVRLNGAIGELFTDWIRKTFPDKAEKVLAQIAACHDGQLNDSRFGKRMRGEGKIAEAVASMFRIAKAKNLKGCSIPPLNLNAFRRPGTSDQLRLFED